MQSLKADLNMVDFVLPRAASFKAAQKWLQMDERTAKYRLCGLLGIGGKTQREMADRQDIRIWEIDWHYWHWRLKESGNEKITLGTVISRIRQHFNLMLIKESWPLQCGYLEA